MNSEISGRGLGLAIVREKAEKVGGAVSVETQPGVGTTFRLILPLTLARFRGVLVRVGESVFVLPARHVLSVLRVSRDEIKSAENRETIQIKGRAASVVRLSDVLEITQTSTDADPKRNVPVLVLAWAGEQIGFVVDEKSNLLTRPGKNQHGYVAFRIGVCACLSNFQDITQAND